jgi:cellulose synthase/poly-beta-1,6-N-acetylglucosamine synthase-like glycosyltransferase
MVMDLIMAIHNEEKYLPMSLRGLEHVPITRFTAVLDRCTDSSEATVRKHFPNADVIKKDIVKWKNTYAENLQLGFQHSTSDIVCIHDADILSTKEMFTILLRELVNTNNASVSPNLLTYKYTSFLNHLYYYWEKTFDLGVGREPWGGLRLIKRSALESVGGFKDVITPDTQLDIDLRGAGYDVKFMKDATCWHMREFTFDKAVKGQIQSGKMRKYMKMSFPRVLAHSIIRLRPFVIYGYLKS